MTWVKIDDGFPDHPKVVGLSDAAFRLHVTALCYAGKYLTDGVIPSNALRRLGGTDEAVSELVEAALWVPNLSDFYIHDYLKHQSSKAQVDSTKQANAERVRRYREKHRNAVTNADVTYPDTDTENREQIQRSDTENTSVVVHQGTNPIPRVNSARTAVQRISDKLSTARQQGVNAWNLSRLVEDEWDDLYLQDDIGGCIALTVWYVQELQSRPLTSPEISRIGQMTKRFGRIALLAIDEAASKDLTDLPSYAFRVAQSLYKERKTN